MFHIFHEYNESSGAGALYYHLPGDTSFTAMTLPTTVSGMKRRAAMEQFDGRMYIVGAFSSGLVVTEDREVHDLGIQAPNLKPTVTATGGQSGFAYINFAHKIGDAVVHQSDLSAASDEGDMSGVERVWGNLPSAAMEERVTHIRGWLSLFGGLPRLTWEREIGTTAVTESMSDTTLALQEAFPNNGADPVLDNGVPPYCRYLKRYHKRMFYAGDPNYPYRVWYSELGFPESVGPLSFFDVEDRETISGLGVNGDRLVIFCNRATYSLQGWTDGSEGIAPDMNISKLISGTGCVSHWSILDINNRLWYAAEDGVRIFDGAFNYMMDDLRTFWKDAYAANSDWYRDSIAVDDKEFHCYVLLIPQTSGGSRRFVGNYLDTDPVVGGQGLQPAWSLDSMNKREHSQGVLTAADGTRTWYSGSCDGYVRSNNVSADTDDDGDSDAKILKIVTGHYFPGQAGWSEEEGGFQIHESWWCVEAEDNTWTGYIYGGDEDAGSQKDEADNQQWSTGTVSASASSKAISGTTYTAVKQGTHYFIPSSVSGEGFTHKVTATSPQGTMKYRGVGGTFGPGPKTRGYSASA